MKSKTPNDQEPLRELTPELMERYLQGSLSPRQRKRVENFLEQNPFEAEAMEGMRLASGSLSMDLMELEDRLSEKTRSKTKSSTRYYWPMAAAVSLLIISGVIFYLMLPDAPQNSTIAINQELDQPEKSAFDTLEVKSPDLPDELPQSPVVQQKQTRADRSEAPQNEVDAIADQEEADEIAHTTTQTNSDPETAATPRVITDAANINEAARQGSQLSGEDEPRNFLAEQSEVEDQLNTPPAAAEISRAAKKEQQPSTAVSSAIAVADLPLADAPDNISTYIFETINYPDQARAQQIEGAVKIKFVVNPDGSTANFEVVDTLGFGCDEAAIEVIESGPAWKPAEINGVPVKSQGEISIRFPPEN